jgi:hypothetical protein
MQKVKKGPPAHHPRQIIGPHQTIELHEDCSVPHCAAITAAAN